MRFGWQKGGRGGAILTPMSSFFTFRGSYVCANFGENKSRICHHVRVPTDTLTDANRVYNLSHAIYYSYGADN